VGFDGRGIDEVAVAVEVVNHLDRRHADIAGGFDLVDDLSLQRSQSHPKALGSDRLMAVRADAHGRRRSQRRTALLIAEQRRSELDDGLDRGPNPVGSDRAYKVGALGGAGAMPGLR